MLQALSRTEGEERWSCKAFSLCVLISREIMRILTLGQQGGRSAFALSLCCLSGGKAMTDLLRFCFLNTQQVRPGCLQGLVAHFPKKGRVWCPL